MTDAAVTEPEPPAKSGKMPLLLGLVLAIAGAGGGYAAVSMGLLPLGGRADNHAPDRDHGEKNEAPEALPDIAFVPMEPIQITFGPGSAVTHLRFRAELEVAAAHAVEVESILPRVVDVLNGYLRALDVADLANPASLTRLRAQMLRRIQIVAGAGRVHDLLIMDFVLK